MRGLKGDIVNHECFISPLSETGKKADVEGRWFVLY